MGGVQTTTLAQSKIGAAGPTLRPWPADQVERRPLASLKPYPRNARAHSDDQVRAIADSMLKWGVTVPVMVDEDSVLIYGHGRLRAAELLVGEGHLQFGELPTTVARGWPEEDKNAYRVADNQLTLLSSWDLPMLKSELTTLNLSGFDMPLMGFPSLKLQQILANPASADPDDAGAIPDLPVTRAGDIWQLGDHRLMCGDATDQEQMLALYGDVRPHLVVSDPPYGVNYEPEWRTHRKIVRVMRDGQRAPQRFAATGLVIGDDQTDWNIVWNISGCEVAYIWHAATKGAIVDRSLRQAGFLPRQQLIWHKPHFSLSRSDYQWQHEACLYAVRRGGKSHWNGDRTQTTVWQIASMVGFTSAQSGVNERTGHSTQKPVLCMQRPMENSSKPGEWVYDPFVGAGTSIIAAELTARRCLAMEIEPAYCDVSLLRWQKIAKREAVLAATGRTYAETVRDRGEGSPYHAPPNQRPAPGLGLYREIQGERGKTKKAPRKKGGKSRTASAAPNAARGSGT